MATLLEILIAFIGVILVLALASQSLLEVVKTVFPVQGFTRMGSTKWLLRESANAENLPSHVGDEIYAAVKGRLRRLGQRGWFGVRLDALSEEQLTELVADLGSRQVPTLKDYPDPADTLKGVAKRVGTWYGLAMEPVSQRYGRRMRVANILGAAVVVLFFNVDAVGLMQRLRTDTELRQQLVGYATTLDSIHTAQADLRQRLADTTAATPTVTPAEADALQENMDSLQVRLSRLVSESTGIFDPSAKRRWDDWNWRLGILLSILLVSLGAPFWNDLLGTIFGFKKQLESRTTTGALGGGGGQGGSGGSAAREPEERPPSQSSDKPTEQAPETSPDERQDEGSDGGEVTPETGARG